MSYTRKLIPGFIVASTDEPEKEYDNDALCIMIIAMSGTCNSDFNFTDRAKFLVDQLERNGYKIVKVNENSPPS